MRGKSRWKTCRGEEYYARVALIRATVVIWHVWNRAVLRS